MMRPIIFFAIGAALVGVASEARVRPGGGGGGIGGGFKPSAPPRPAAHPAPRPGLSPRPGTLPAKNPGNGIGNHGPGHGPGPIKPSPGHPNVPPGGKPGGPNKVDVGKFLGTPTPGHFPTSPGYRPGYTGYHKAEFHQNIYTHFPYHPVYGYPFGKDWCAHFHWHYSQWPYWTAAATGATLARWIGYPNYNGYGSSQQVVYYPVEPAPQQVYEQSVGAPQELVQQGQPAVAEDSNWMNLGTFGIIPYQKTDFAYAVQLATTKDGTVRGIQWDMSNNTSTEVLGSIDKTTLKVAWAATSAGALMFESNVDELTQKESRVNVYDLRTKGLVSWQLIQIEESDLPKNR